MDFGAHNGGDLPYFLKKFEQVVAIEANPSRVDEIRNNQAEAIRAGRLIVIHAALTASPVVGEVELWLDDENDVKSSLLKPSPTEAKTRKLLVSAISIQELWEKFGVPDYVKIDLEGYDIAILRAIRESGKWPANLSAEAHSTSVLDEMAMFGFSGYKILRGKSVSSRYNSFGFKDLNGQPAQFSFPWHSSGPIGEDLPGSWYSLKDARKILALVGPGWVDIHSSDGVAESELGKLQPSEKFLVSGLSMLPSWAYKILPKRFSIARRRLVRKFVN